MTDAGFVRLQVRYISRTGAPVGVLVAVDHLRRAGRLSLEETLQYVEVDEWFVAHLPTPPFYADGNSIGAITWFTSEAADSMVDRLAPLRALLDRHEVPHDLVRSADPGNIVYEDHWQVGAVPRVRQRPTTLPAGVCLGPTTAGSKRHLLPPSAG